MSVGLSGFGLFGLPGLDVHVVSAYVRRYQRDMQGLESVGPAPPVDGAPTPRVD